MFVFIVYVIVLFYNLLKLFGYWILAGWTIIIITILPPTKALSSCPSFYMYCHLYARGAIVSSRNNVRFSK